MNKITAVFLLTGVLAIGCTEVTFKEPQPAGIKALSAVPQKLQGAYLFPDDDSGSDSEDTLIIVEKGYRVGYVDPHERLTASELEEGLSDSLVLKYYKGYYFISHRENPSSWSLRVLRRQKNGDLLYYQMPVVPEEVAKRKEFLRHLAAITRVDSVATEFGIHYTIQPTPSQLMKIRRKGFMTSRILHGAH